MSMEDRIRKLERAIKPAEPLGIAIVRIDAAACPYDALPEAEREAMVAEQLGRPRRDGDLEIVIERVTSA